MEMSGKAGADERNRAGDLAKDHSESVVRRPPSATIRVLATSSTSGSAEASRKSHTTVPRRSSRDPPTSAIPETRQRTRSDVAEKNSASSISVTRGSSTSRTAITRKQNQGVTPLYPTGIGLPVLVPPPRCATRCVTRAPLPGSERASKAGNCASSSPGDPGPSCTLTMTGWSGWICNFTLCDGQGLAPRSLRPVVDRAVALAEAGGAGDGARDEVLGLMHRIDQRLAASEERRDGS